MTAEMSRTTASAPGRSALLTTKRSAISMRPAFMACMASPPSGTTGDDYGVSEAHDVELGLTDAHCLNDRYIGAVNIEELHSVAGAPGEAALAAAGGHAADVDAGVLVVALHADSVCKDGTSGEGAGGVGGEDADRRGVG